MLLQENYIRKIHFKGDIMPELPEVETVKETLKKQILNKMITEVEVFYEPIIATSISVFKEKIQNKTIMDIQRRGKWLLFDLEDSILLSHLRMEGKYFLLKNEEVSKHEHVVFHFADNTTLRYHDTRKFGRMYLLEKKDAYQQKPLCELGLEPWDQLLTVNYLKQCYRNKTIPIKSVLLDQTIVVGIGNIYADEILFMSHINPYTLPSCLQENDLKMIIKNTQIVLEKAILLGGTTVRSYTSSEGVHGRFQNELLIHTKKICPNCSGDVLKVKINGRGTYYCPNCQKKAS